MIWLFGLFLIVFFFLLVPAPTWTSTYCPPLPHPHSLPISHLPPPHRAAGDAVRDGGGDRRAGERRGRGPVAARSRRRRGRAAARLCQRHPLGGDRAADRKSTRLNSSH